MQANWSLVLNVLLLIGVVIAIGRLMKARRQSFHLASAGNSPPPLGKMENKYLDEIIAVRKISQENPVEPLLSEVHEAIDPITAKVPVLMPHEASPMDNLDDECLPEKEPLNEPGKSIMMFLQAKENRTLAGYELLQTVLAAGLRFGEGHLFHRHQQVNGQGPVLFSLAAATATGVFDLQNIGAFSVRGLCLFMSSSGNATLDGERLNLMLETAKQLKDDLDAILLDEKQSPLSPQSLTRYSQRLNLKEALLFREDLHLV